MLVISQNMCQYIHNHLGAYSLTPITGITDEVNRCYQPSVDEKWPLEEGGE